jgi:hypothetical protein
MWVAQDSSYDLPIVRTIYSTTGNRGVILHTCNIGVMPVPPAIMPNSLTILGVYVNAPFGPLIPTVSPISKFATQLETDPVGYDCGTK